jgi:hypothetical protein
MRSTMAGFRLSGVPYLPVVGDLLAVDEDRGAARFLAADAHALQSRLPRVGDLHAGHAAHGIGEPVSGGTCELLAVDHADGLAGVEHDAWRATRGDHDLLEQRHLAARFRTRCRDDRARAGADRGERAGQWLQDSHCRASSICACIVSSPPAAFSSITRAARA